jgi:diguanylate cyclase (GGDEF)-like protein/PAS domain S-box-containing protein
MALRDATAQVASLRDQLAMRIGVAAVLFAGLLALLWSITGAAERQLAAAFLGTRESEARFRSLFDNAIAGMAVHEIVLDERGKPADYIYVQANRGFETHTGLRIADVLGRRATEVFAGGGEAPLIDDYGKVVLTGEPATLERYFEPLERHYHIGAYRVAPGRFATVFLDITERKRMEQALQTERDNLKAIFAASPVGMLLLDEDTVITDCNGVIARAVSRDPGQILRRRAGNGLGCIHSGETEGGCGFAPACQQCRLRQGIVQVLKGGTSLHGAEIHASLLINGEQRRPWLKVSAQPVVLNGRRHVVVAVDDITEHKALEEELRTAARLDRLTGLPNRALFLDRLQRAVVRRRQSRKEPAYAVLFLDFDRFKIINDSLGHDAGDRLLCEIARRLRETLGVVDSVSSAARGTTAARLGGDEFVVLLDSLESPAEAQAVAERLLDALGAPYQLDGREVVSTASIGIVKGEYDYERADDVLRDADTAMYEAKLAGKGRALMFDGSMRERVQRKLELESGLRRGLDSGQFILHYQPIISLESGRIEGFEALVRWQHPEHGMVSPGEFIPVAEETGLIVPLGEWVFREACRQRAAWQAMLGRDATPSLSVNLSRNQLASAGLPRRLVEIAAEAGVDPQSIHLEVTESAIMSDTKLAADVLRELKTVGFRVDMDDFGTGYSSLACLHQFPIDVLKIDRSFIANLDRGRDFAALVNAIAMLARNLGIEVVAEGVETPDQVTMLQSLECQLAQGYYFARPMPADQVLAYCRNGRKAAA